MASQQSSVGKESDLETPDLHAKAKRSKGKSLHRHAAREKHSHMRES